jgi:cobalt-zinc-cadmium resistance protein CzcA
MGVNLSDTFVVLNKDKSKWTLESKNDLFDKIRGELLKINPDQDVSATQPIEMRFNEILEGSRADVTLRIFGLNLEGLVKAIDSAKSIIEKIPGVDTVGSDALTALKTSPMLDLTPIYSSQARYGVTLSELNHLIELSMGGREVGSFIDTGKRFPIMIHLDESLRENLDTIETLPVGLPRGGTIPLNNLAKLTIQDRVTTIARSWGERYAAVSINIQDRDIASFVAEAQAKIGSQLKLDHDMRLNWGGQFKNLDRAKKRLLIIVPLTLAAVFIILLRSFGSLADTLLVFSSIPFAAVGGIYALWIRGMHLSVSAAVGFIALIGIALLNSLVLMNVLNRSSFTSLTELKRFVSAAALSRLRPVLMTALVASLGFLPMALNTGIGAEVQKPLATVVIGGLITATMLTLILLPLLFILLKGRKMPVVHRKLAST